MENLDSILQLDDDAIVEICRQGGYDDLYTLTLTSNALRKLCQPLLDERNEFYRGDRKKLINDIVKERPYYLLKVFLSDQEIEELIAIFFFKQDWEMIARIKKMKPEYHEQIEEIMYKIIKMTSVNVELYEIIYYLPDISDNLLEAFVEKYLFNDCLRIEPLYEVYGDRVTSILRENREKYYLNALKTHSIYSLRHILEVFPNLPFEPIANAIHYLERWINKLIYFYKLWKEYNDNYRVIEYKVMLQYLLDKFKDAPIRFSEDQTRLLQELREY